MQDDRGRQAQSGGIVDGGAAGAARFAQVMSPLRVGPLTFRNRIIVPAHTTNFGEDHLPSERHRAYHAARAAGGVGAIIFESIRVHPNSLGRPQAVGGFDPRCIDPFRRVTDAVKAHDVRILGQIIHLGRHVEGDFERTVSWSASDIPWSATAMPPRPMDRDDMDAVIEGHLVTARNLVAAGFEGIELQMAHGHLLQQFMSPLSNRRDDEYGGPTANRLRFPLEVLAAVRAELGDDFCLGVRLSGDEYVDGGMHIDEMEDVARMLARTVRIDFFNVSHSAYHASYSLATQMADMAFDPSPFRTLPARIRAALRADGHDAPVFAVCRFTGLAQAQEAIAAGVADAVGMARAHIADPDLVAKTLAGREEEVRTCIACNQGCAGMLEKNLPIRCLVNPRAGLEFAWVPAPRHGDAPRRVLVVGGGPAGMEAAIAAAERGHAVTLWERGTALGGQLGLTRSMTLRDGFAVFLDHQAAALRRLGVEVCLGFDADAQSIAAFGADRVFLATGSDPVAAAVPGGGKAFGLTEALADPGRLGRNVAFFDLTGDWAALATMEHLAALGTKLRVFVPVAGFAWRTTIYSTLANSRRLRELGVRIFPLSRLSSWDGARLMVENVSSGEVETVTGQDAVVVAQHNCADQSLFKALRRLDVPVSQIGDNVAPRTALEAVYHGHVAVRQMEGLEQA